MLPIIAPRAALCRPSPVGAFVNNASAHASLRAPGAGDACDGCGGSSGSGGCVRCGSDDREMQLNTPGVKTHARSRPFIAPRVLEAVAPPPHLTRGGFFEWQPLAGCPDCHYGPVRLPPLSRASLRRVLFAPRVGEGVGGEVVRPATAGHRAQCPSRRHRPGRRSARGTVRLWRQRAVSETGAGWARLGHHHHPRHRVGPAARHRPAPGGRQRPSRAVRAGRAAERLRARELSRRAGAAPGAGRAPHRAGGASHSKRV
jgi:hypothetical protein